MWSRWHELVLYLDNWLKNIDEKYVWLKLYSVSHAGRFACIAQNIHGTKIVFRMTSKSARAHYSGLSQIYVYRLSCLRCARLHCSSHTYAISSPMYRMMCAIFWDGGETLNRSISMWLLAYVSMCWFHLYVVSQRDAFESCWLCSIVFAFTFFPVCRQQDSCSKAAFDCTHRSIYHVFDVFVFECESKQNVFFFFLHCKSQKIRRRKYRRNSYHLW